MPEAHLFLVDPWKAYRGYRDHVSQEKLDGFYEATEKRMAAVRESGYTLVRRFSMDALKYFKDGQLDFAFIDANHSFDFVMEDIIHWSKKVRPNGIVSGHDYFVGKGNRNHQVPIAVRAYTEAHNISPWFVCRGDHSPTWFYVKQ
jgi:predicted O-methyltransferase YrrM